MPGHCSVSLSETVFREQSLRATVSFEGTDNVQGQISEYICYLKRRLLCLLSLKTFSRHAALLTVGEYLSDIF